MHSQIRCTRRQALALLLSSAAMLPLPVVAQTRVRSLNVTYGWDEDITAPTQATFYVSLDGDDRNNGSLDTPFRTIQHGVTKLAQHGSGSLAIRGGTYRESIFLGDLQGRPDAPYIIHRYGSERVTISAAETLDGWSPITAEDGLSVGILNPQNVYRTRIALSSLQHGSPLALNIFVNGKRCILGSTVVQRSGINKATEAAARLNATRFELDAADMVLAVQDDRLIGMPASYLHQAQVVLYHSPNAITAQPISAFSSRDGRITLTDQTRRAQPSQDGPVSRYALENVGLQLRQNEWIMRQTADGQVDIYLKSTDLARPDTIVEASVRSFCTDLGKANNLTLFGLDMIRAAGPGRLDGICLRRTDLSQESTNLSIQHCRFGENYTVYRRGYGAVFIRNSRNLNVVSCTIVDSLNCFGLAIFETNAAHIQFVHISGISQSPMRFYTLQSCTIAFSLIEDSAFDAHANKMNFYEGCDSVLVYGVKSRNVAGYATFQESSRIHFAFNEFDADQGVRGRALVAQNRNPGANQGGPDGSGEPRTGQISYIWNNTLLPDPDDLSLANSLSLGPEHTSQTYAVHNNILHGGGFADIYLGNTPSNRMIRSHNLYTGLAFWQVPRRGWSFAEAEHSIRPYANIITRGKDMGVIVEYLAPHFPNFAWWDCDIDGYKIDWGLAPTGCYS